MSFLTFNKIEAIKALERLHSVQIANCHRLDTWLNEHRDDEGYYQYNDVKCALCSFNAAKGIIQIRPLRSDWDIGTGAGNLLTINVNE